MPTVGVPGTGFVHEALVHHGDGEFVRWAARFVDEGLEAGDAVVVAAPRPRLDLLRERLDDRADRIICVDIAVAGRNPGRIIPLWRSVLDDLAGQPVRAIGQPAYPGRTDGELAECVLHEAMLNLAFDDEKDFRLTCPYDAATLPTSVLAGLGATHQVVTGGAAGFADAHGEMAHGEMAHGEMAHERRALGQYAPEEIARSAFEATLPEPPPDTERWTFGRSELSDIRVRVREYAAGRGLSADRAGDLALAAHEIGKNTIRFGGAAGTLSLWAEDDRLVCEIADSGRITELLVGRRLPSPLAEGGRGIWLANQLCDLVQLRSGPAGTTVRLHISR